MAPYKNMDGVRTPQGAQGMVVVTHQYIHPFLIHAIGQRSEGLVNIDPTAALLRTS